MYKMSRNDVWGGLYGKVIYVPSHIFWSKSPVPSISCAGSAYFDSSDTSKFGSEISLSWDFGEPRGGGGRSEGWQQR